MEAVQSEVSGSEAEDDDLIPHNEFNDVVDELSGEIVNWSNLRDLKVACGQ